jgi:hypothetical protein
LKEQVLELEFQGIIQIWNPDQAYDAIKGGPGKLARQAGDVRAAMRRNSEVLIEGRIPSGMLLSVNT